MQRRQFGLTKQEVPVIGQGTWYGQGDDRKSAIAALRKGIELGLTHIDTAEMYLSGKAERWVGEAISPVRDEIFLVSKVLPENASRKGTIKACEGSLRRLKTDRLDCYLLHWRGEHPLEDTIEAFKQLQAEGKILSWGVSNFDVADLKEARELGGDEGPACNQVLCHLKERGAEHRVAPWCEKHHTAFVSYSPFGHDSFPGPRTPGGRALNQIADEHDATPRQVALRFLLRRPFSFTIPKSSDVDHVIEIAGAGDLQLTGMQIKRIDGAFPRGPIPRELPTL